MCKCHPGEAQMSNNVSVWSAGLCDLRVYTLFIIDGLPEKGGNAFWIQRSKILDELKRFCVKLSIMSIFSRWALVTLVHFLTVV